MERFLNIKKIVNLLELGFYFKCLIPNHDKIGFYKKNGIFYVVLDKFREYPLKKDVEEIANIIYTSDYYVFSNSKESLPDTINTYKKLIKINNKEKAFKKQVPIEFQDY